MKSKVRGDWKDHLNTIVNNSSEDDVDYIFQIFELLLSNNHPELARLYKLVDLELFTQIIYLFNGKVIKYPTIEEFKDSLILALVFYYHEKLGMSWKKIQEKVPFKINAVQYSKKISGINNFLKQKMMEIFNILDLESGVKK